MRSVAECAVRPTHFVTLTYPRRWPTPDGAKDHLRRFTSSLRCALQREDGDTCFVWRMEPQQRGAPHFHLLLWHTGHSKIWGRASTGHRGWRSRLSAFRGSRPESSPSTRSGTTPFYDAVSMLSCVWHQATDSDSADHLRCGVDLELLGDDKKVVNYVSKYSAKVSAVPFVDTSTGEVLDCGRVWGWRGDRSIPVALPLATWYPADLDRRDDALGTLWKEMENEYGMAAVADDRTSYGVFCSGADALERLGPTVDGGILLRHNSDGGGSGKPLLG